MYITVRVQTTNQYRQKPRTTDLKTNYDAETDTSTVEKIKNRRKQNFEGKQHAIR